MLRPTAPSGFQTPIPINRQTLEAKQAFLVSVQVWPLESKLNVRGWLGNFDAHEQQYAVHLLNGFVYVPEMMVESLFHSTFHNLGRVVLNDKRNNARTRGDWTRFIQSLLVVNVTGEAPSATDSGYIFMRMARDVLRISAERIVGAEAAIRQLLRDPTLPVVFVDDFVGSGNQFTTTWHRPYAEAHGLSFATLAKTTGGLQSFYVPLVATQDGIDNLRRDCPGVVVLPAHVIDSRYNALAPESIIWPASIRDEGARFVQSSSARAGIGDENGGVNDWRGYNKLGLCLGFAHGTPDATLPLFYWEQNGWIPLVRRVHD